MAQHTVSLATQGMSLPPGYRYLREIEPSGSARCHLAIDPGDPPSSTPLDAVADAVAESQQVPVVLPAQGRDARVTARELAPSTRRLVAVHLAPAALAANDGLRAQFAARAAAFSPLRHPNLVATFAADSRRERCHWVSEFVPGEPLSRLLAKTKRGRRALSTRQLLTIVCDVASALDHAHGAVDGAGKPRPVVHGNLCPDSVFVTYEGVVKVSAELGCSALQLSASEHVELPARFDYLAPECCGSGPGDARRDVYALGAILWEALAGRPRSLGVAPKRALALRLRGGEPDLADVCPHVLPALAATVRRALSTDPGARHPSVGALRAELEQIAQLDVLGNETSPLFGFMCNYFFDEYAALQALLEEHGMLHALFAHREMLRTGSRALPRAGARAMSAPAHDSSLRESGLRRVPESSVPPPTTHSRDRAPGVSRGGADRARQARPPRLSLREAAQQLTRAPGRARTSFIVVGVAVALALGFAWKDDRLPGTASLGSAEPAVVAPSVAPQRSTASHLLPASAARFPIPLGPVMTLDPPAGATAAGAPSALAPSATVELAPSAASIPPRPAPERSTWKRQRPVRDSSPSPARRRDATLRPDTGSVLELAMSGAAPRADLGEHGADGTGVDLRMLKQRPPRAIDTQNPYSP